MYLFISIKKWIIIYLGIKLAKSLGLQVLNFLILLEIQV